MRCCLDVSRAHYRCLLIASVAALVCLVQVSASLAASTPVGDTVYVSAYNMPTHFGRALTGTLPDLEWDPNNGAGLPMTFGTATALPPLGGGVTVDDQVTVHLRINTWAGSAIPVSTPDNGVISNTTFEKPGEILQIDFTRTNGQSLSNIATNYDPFGFLIEDLQWRDGGVADTRPILFREDTFFFWFTKNGSLAPILPSFASLVSLGPHPFGEVAEVFHSIDSLTDLSDPNLFYEADEDTLFDTGTAYVGLNPEAAQDYPIGALQDIFLGVSPINDVHAGILIARAKYGDANLDDIVDGGDYTIWADNYLQTGKAWQTGDFNNDDIVDGGDYTLWADNYEPGGAAMANAVPEPASCVLAISGMLLCGVCAWRRRGR